MKKITYIFTRGRIAKVDNIEFSDDFFYGYRYLIEQKYDLNALEFIKTNKVLSKIEHILSRIFSLPLYVFSIYTRKNYQMLKHSDHIFLVSESTGFAVLPMLFFLKKSNQIKTHMFVMGLFSKKINFIFFKNFHRFLIKTLVNNLDKLYFLGKEEFNLANELIKDNNKLHFTSFYIDTNFWKQENLDIQKNTEILFVGNDGNRNYELLIKIAEVMSEYNFVFVSKHETITNLNLPNVRVLKGSWNSNILTDKDLREIYLSSRIVILPLIESNQPSGQSVTLQSMSLGIPVIISNTNGFWDKDSFINNENIVFENSNTPISWKKSIESLYNDVSKLNNISKNSINLVHEKYNLEIFNKFLLNEINNDTTL